MTPGEQITLLRSAFHLTLTLCTIEILERASPVTIHVRTCGGPRSPYESQGITSSRFHRYNPHEQIYADRQIVHTKRKDKKTKTPQRHTKSQTQSGRAIPVKKSAKVYARKKGFRCSSSQDDIKVRRMKGSRSTNLPKASILPRPSW